MRGAKNLRPTQKGKKKKERKKGEESKDKKNQINMTAISVEDWQENGLLF